MFDKNEDFVVAKLEQVSHGTSLLLEFMINRFIAFAYVFWT
jgi:hypothetical protein